MTDKAIQKFRQVPKCFDTSGAHFILVNPNSKIPHDQGWNKIGGINYTFDEINELLKQDQYEDFNIGKVLGAGEVDIEFDTQEAQDKYQPLLGETLQFKSAIKGTFHNIFISDIKLTTAINDTEGKRAVDILAGKIGAEGKLVYSQALIPPSFIKTDTKGTNINRAYEVTKYIIPKYISEEEINTIFGLTKQEEFMVAEHTMKDIGPVREEIKNKVSITTELQRYGIPTKKAKKYNTQCPLPHKDKNGKDLVSMSGANFHVDEDKHNWYCHNDVCKKGGDVLTLRALKEGKSIEEVASEFAEELGLDYDSGKDNSKIWIQHPGKGKTQTEFDSELGDILRDKDNMFVRPESKRVIEVRKIKVEDGDNKNYEGIVDIEPNRFVTLIEEYVEPYIIEKNTKTDKFIKKVKSINTDISNKSLVDEALLSRLKIIKKILKVPIPMMWNNELTFPKKGYDERFKSWISTNSPDLSNPNMGLQEALLILKDIYKEFCFKDKQDYSNAISALITPYLKGLYHDFNTRAPIFCYLANRERSGKDYCAGITGIVYEDLSLEEPPLSTSDTKYIDTSDELRKKILSALKNGRQRLHFANNKGFINNSTLEAVSTARVWSDRELGKSENLTFDNTIDFSLSGNVGITYTPDLANRMVIINLFLDIEDANSRKFKNPNLHEYISKKRGEVLSALFALVRNWIDRDSVPGSVPFTSFPEWARVCGGIMESAGFLSPCLPNSEMIGLDSDLDTSDMKALFELSYSIYPDKLIQKEDMISIIQQNGDEMFNNIDFESKSGKITFGLKLKKYIGRIQSGILMKVDNNNNRASRQKFLFTKQTQTILKPNIFE